MNRKIYTYIVFITMILLCIGCNKWDFTEYDAEIQEENIEIRDKKNQDNYVKTGEKQWYYYENGDKYLNGDTKYDNQGNVIQDCYRVYENGGFHLIYRYYENEYDENGNPTSALVYMKYDDGTMELEDEREYENTYDFSGKLINRRYYEVQEGGPDLETTETFYEDGGLRSVTWDYGDPGDVTVGEFSEIVDEYDERGRVIQESLYYGEDLIDVYKFFYNEQNNITQIRCLTYYPEETQTTIDYTVECKYDDSDRLVYTSCIGESDDETNIRENLFGIGYASVISTYEYDLKGNYIQRVKYCQQDGTVIREIETSYEKVSSS